MKNYSLDNIRFLKLPHSIISLRLQNVRIAIFKLSWHDRGLKMLLIWNLIIRTQRLLERYKGK
jgi:hypothetical protein